MNFGVWILISPNCFKIVTWKCQGPLIKSSVLKVWTVLTSHVQSNITKIPPWQSGRNVNLSSLNGLALHSNQTVRSGKVAKGYPLASNKVNLRIMLEYSKFKSVPLKKTPGVLGNLSNTLTLWDSWFCLWRVSLSLTMTKILIRLQQNKFCFAL